MTAVHILLLNERRNGAMPFADVSLEASPPRLSTTAPESRRALTIFDTVLRLVPIESAKSFRVTESAEQRASITDSIDDCFNFTVCFLNIVLFIVKFFKKCVHLIISYAYRYVNAAF